MRLLLIRHAESVDNVAGLYGGVSDAALTNHGILQTQRLASHLHDDDNGGGGPEGASPSLFTHVFSSDLQRARRTGDAIVDGQNARLDAATLEPGDVAFLRQLPVLREQDFGSLERQPWAAAATKALFDRPPADGRDARGRPWVAPESKASLERRADEFLDGHLMPLLETEGTLPLTVKDEGNDDEEEKEEKTTGSPKVAVVSHGMLLSRLWKRLLARCPDWKTDVKLGPEIEVGPRGLEHLGGWSNTGYLDLELKARTGSQRAAPSAPDDGESQIKVVDQSEPPKGESVEVQQEQETSTETRKAQDGEQAGSVDDGQERLYKTFLTITVKGVNVTDHLKGLKKTRGGIGSAAYDDSQKSIHSFFKRRKVEN